MSHEENRPEDLKALEAALAALVPRGDRLQRDRLMFLAGRAAASRPGAAVSRRWAWPAAFSAMTAVAASLLVMLVTRPGPQIVERIVEVPAESILGGGQGGSEARSLAAGEKPGYSLPEFAPGKRSNGMALAYGPLAVLRSPEMSGRLDGAPEAAWLDEVFAPSAGSRSAPAQLPATQPSPETPVPYGELRERLLEGPAASPAARPPVPGVFGFHGARS
jgi:hypothetical protein